MEYIKMKTIKFRITFRDYRPNHDDFSVIVEWPNLDLQSQRQYATYFAGHNGGYKIEEIL